MSGLSAFICNSAIVAASLQSESWIECTRGKKNAAVMPRKVNRASCSRHRLYFMTEQALDQHMRTDHIDLFCEVCSRSFANSATMRLHRQIVHGEQVKRK